MDLKMLVWVPSPFLFKLDPLSVKTINCSWFIQFDTTPPHGMHLYFTFLQNAFSRSTKVVGRTLVMIHMLCKMTSRQLTLEQTLIHKRHISL
jgi:hypothetical protein